LDLPGRSSADPDHPRRRGVGIIAALGLGPAGLAVGDEVFGLTDQLRDGTAAEYVAVEALNLAPKPQTVESSRAQLAGLARLVDQGHLRPQVGAVYPLAQAAGAYSAKAVGGIPGRIVLQP
jgi:NADPH:quinone reductase-like Zn-dependent oxidoreductase